MSLTLRAVETGAVGRAAVGADDAVAASRLPNIHGLAGRTGLRQDGRWATKSSTATPCTLRTIREFCFLSCEVLPVVCSSGMSSSSLFLVAMVYNIIMSSEFKKIQLRKFTCVITELLFIAPLALTFVAGRTRNQAEAYKKFKINNNKINL